MPAVTTAYGQRRADQEARFGERHLAEEPGHRGDAGQVHGRDEVQDAQQGCEPGEATELDQAGAAGPPFDQAQDEEQTGLDGDVVHDVEDRAGVAGRRRRGRCPNIM